MAHAVYMYFICKLIELLDTVFFVLRKKDRQISFLHLYHHFMMPICGWIGSKFFAGGHVTLLGLINSFVHIFMYTYYMLTAFGPHMQKYLWWKKYLTTMQIVQFVIIFLQNLRVLFTTCNFPKPLTFLLVLNSGIFFYMFSSFYINNYIKTKPRQTKSNGVAVNGGAVNGTVVNGGAVNGTAVNGAVNGTAVNGAINGTAVNGAVNGTAVAKGFANGVTANGVNGSATAAINGVNHDKCD